MSELTIGRMTVAVVDWPNPGQVFGMLRRVADSRLDDALREQPLPEGEWCVRRLDLALDLDAERPLSALETGWADRIITALRQSLRDGSSDIVRFVRPEDAVDDLFAGLAVQDYDRAWAWRQVGIIEPGDPLPEDDARGLFLTVLRRLHHGGARAVERLIARVGVAPAHRLLGAQGWVQTAVIASRDAGASWWPTRSGEAAPLLDLSAAHGSSTDRGGPAPAFLDPALVALSSQIAASGTLAQAFRRSGLRVDESTLEAWAVLAIAEVDPLLLRRADDPLRDLVCAVAERLQPPAQPGIPPSSHPVAPARVTARPRSGEPGDTAHPDADDVSAAPAPGREADDDSTSSTAPDREVAGEAPAGLPTSWGGLLFLLNTASDAGIPEALDEPPFRARPSGWVLHRLALRLVPAGADDPAFLALAGLSEPPTGEPDEIEERALGLCAARWAQHTADRLRATGTVGRDDAAVVHRVAKRNASVACEPGWIELSLALDDVDLDIRRAGLDIDPGWVAWLGRVVRFRYE